ncbi:GNAT family N-acetyltransferase [Cognatilysobacter bugurensis]|nr:GNAT family protein [Lysobacter bugurensis]
MHATASDTAANELPVLNGTRLRLRGIETDDFDAFYALHSDPQAMRYWSFPAWTAREQAQAYFETACSSRDPGRMLCWAMADIADDALIGAATLCDIDREQGRATVGYVLSRDRWGRGLAREAVSLMLVHAFDTLALRRVEADIDPRNEASCRLVERVGFRREGLLRERWHTAGELCDTVMYGLLAREFVRDA